MRARIWGCRGSLATPGPTTVAYGGNTSCVEVRTSADALLVLDAGSGIRPLGAAVEGVREVHLLLTHLHLDHVEGLGFFAPLHDPACAVTIWGPPQEGSSLAARLETWLSPPFFPVPFGQIEAGLEVREVRDESFQIGDVEVTCATVAHPGATLGFRLVEGTRSFAYIPDNEAALDPAPAAALAAGVDVLLHDAQYTEEEYASRARWGHSSVADFAAVAAESGAGRALMFHHDPAHDDARLDEMRAEAERLAGRPVELAQEGLGFD